MKLINRILLFTLLFSPLISYLLETRFRASNALWWYFSIIFLVSGTIYILETVLTQKSLSFPAYLIPFYFYILYNLIWAFANGEMARRGFAMVVFNNTYTKMLMLILVICNTAFSDRFIKWSLRIMYVTIVLAFIVSIIQVFWPLFLSPDYAVDKYNLYTIRRASIFGYGNPLEFGYSLLALLALVLAHFSKKSPGKVVPILVMGGITCILSNTRWIMGSFVILLIMIAIHYRERLLGRIKTILLILIVMIILTYALSSLGYDFNEFYQKRLLAEGSLDQTSRFFAYQNFLRFFPQGPWFGNGEYMSEEVWIASNAFGSSQIHVGYLAHLVAFGAIGSLFLFGFWFALTLNLRKTAMKTGYWGSFYAFLVFLWSNVTLVHYTIFFYGLIFALIFDKHYKDKNKSDLMFTPLVIKGDAG